MRILLFIFIYVTIASTTQSTTFSDEDDLELGLRKGLRKRFRPKETVHAATDESILIVPQDSTQDSTQVSTQDSTSLGSDIDEGWYINEIQTIMWITVLVYMIWASMTK